MYETNKKHKGVWKGTKRMDFDNYSSRKLFLDELGRILSDLLKKQAVTFSEQERQYEW